jgi:nitroimidazol reductase NimA-like FMN-containing flavoprotein (pyridoxamine 5'-phosphate oxidase superfamily)
MDIVLSGPWDFENIETFLTDSTIPVRLSCNAADGFPRVISLWYGYEAQTLYCVTHQSSKLVALLQRNQQVGFDISPDTPPYCGIRGQGTASLQPLGDSPMLEQLLMRYVGNLDSGFSKWLLSRSAEELLITINPHALFSWDYRKRMSKA